MHRLLLLITLPGTALAHEGHGAAAAHGHMGEVFGFAALAVAIAGALIWRARR